MKSIKIMTMRRDYYTPYMVNGYTGAPFTLEANFYGDADEPESINLTSCFDDDYQEAQRYCLEHGMRWIWANQESASESLPDFYNEYDNYDD